MKIRTALDGALVVCALFIVGLVARREFASSPMPTLPSVQMRMIASATWDQVVSGGHLLFGSAQAPVKIVEFGDFQCGACAVARDEMRALHERNPDLVAVIYRHYPLRAIHEHAYAAAVASECAADQGVFQAYYDALFDHQVDLGKASWAGLAKAAQVRDTADFVACLDRAESHRRVARDTAVAYHVGVRGTPTFVVNGNVLLSNPVAGQWDRLVQEFAREDTAAEAVGRASLARDGAPACPLTRTAVSPPDVEFSYITDLAVDSRGLIYVGDRFVYGVTVLRGDGTLSHRIGRAGDGPGEFRFVRNVSVLPEDSVAVFDVQHGRLTVFAPGGDRVAYTVNFAEAAPGLRPPRAVQLIPGRRRIVAQYAEPYRVGQDARADREPVQLVRVLDWAGVPQGGTALVLPGPQSLVARSGSAIRVGMHPFGFPALVRIAPDGRIYFGKGDSLAIREYDLDGKRVGEVRREYDPPRLTAEDLEWGAGQVSDALRRVLREAAPERWPAFRQFVVDDAGRLWIGLDTPRGEPQVWAVLSRSGDVLCRALLPDDVEILRVRGTTAYASVKDDMDVPRIAVFQWQGTP